MEMAKMTLEEARKVVHALSPEDREILAIELGLEMGKGDPEIEKSWLEEADRRWQAIENGSVKTIPGHVARSEVRALINERD